MQRPITQQPSSCTAVKHGQDPFCNSNVVGVSSKEVRLLGHSWREGVAGGRTDSRHFVCAG